METVSQIFAKSGILYPAPKILLKPREGMVAFTGQLRRRLDDGTYVMVSAAAHVTAETYENILSGVTKGLIFEDGECDDASNTAE